MNDPGLHQPIDHAEDEVQRNVPDRHGNTQTNELHHEDEFGSYVMPARWWYASTAFPLLAGTFGPMANAFSICALVENWRASLAEGQDELQGTAIPDPKWLIGVNALSLAFALIANLSLLLNMAKRLPFPIAQPITILGFWMASFLLIVLLGYVARDLRDPGVEIQVLTQAYYYAIFAAVLYQIVSYLMCITVWGAYTGKYSKQFELTMSQRTLMLQTISFLTYQHLGALAYCHIENWGYLDAVYWADFTNLTVGIGDTLVPQTHLGRSILFPFAMGGIIILGLVVGSIRSLVLERGEKKMAARLTEKTRLRVVKLVENVSQGQQVSRRRRMRTIGKEVAGHLTREPTSDAAAEEQRRMAEFAAMRKVQRLAQKERRYMSLVISIFAFGFLWLVGAVIFWITESNVQQWSYFDALYFAYTSLTTIGYGDLQPMTNAGRPFFVFWSLLAVPTLTILISNMGDTVVKGVKDATIWIGEVTVLPNDEHTIRARLRYGLWKITHGRISDRDEKMDIEKKAGTENNNNDDDGQHGDENDSDEDEDVHEMNPGPRPLGHDRSRSDRSRNSRREQSASDRIAQDFERAEERHEIEAKSRGDKIAEGKYEDKSK